MNREEAHKLIDEMFDKGDTVDGIAGSPANPTELEPKKELPKDKRVVRTKTSGDRVYLIDEVAKTRAWLTSLEVLQDQGFEMDDVKEVEDLEMLRYNMSPAIYKTNA